MPPFNLVRGRRHDRWSSRASPQSAFRVSAPSPASQLDRVLAPALTVPTEPGPIFDFQDVHRTKTPIRARAPRAPRTVAESHIPPAGSGGLLPVTTPLAYARHQEPSRVGRRNEEFMSRSDRGSVGEWTEIGLLISHQPPQASASPLPSPSIA